MASDVVLLLRSEHRRLLALVERCERTARGLHDPVAQLRRELWAHAAAAGEEITAAAPRGERPPEQWVATLDRVADLAADAAVPALRRVTTALVQTEDRVLLPWLGQALTLDERRRVGKLYRVRRDSHSRTRLSRRQRSRTELYEKARRAGVENRSRMTQAELQAAVEAWESARAPRTAGGRVADGQVG